MEFHSNICVCGLHVCMYDVHMYRKVHYRCKRVPVIPYNTVMPDAQELRIGTQLITIY